MPKFFRFKDLAGEGIPFCRMHVDRLEHADNFPKRVRIGPNTVAWLADEIRAYVDAKIAARDQDRDKAEGVVEVPVPKTPHRRGPSRQRIQGVGREGRNDNTEQIATRGRGPDEP